MTEGEFKHLLLQGLRELEETQGATAEASNALTDQEIEAIIGATDSKGLWKLQVAAAINKDALLSRLLGGQGKHSG